MIVEVSFILYVYGAFEFIFLVASFSLNVQIKGFLFIFDIQRLINTFSIACCFPDFLKNHVNFIKHFDKNVLILDIYF